MGNNVPYSPGEFRRRVKVCAESAAFERPSIEWTVVGIGVLTMVAFLTILHLALTDAVPLPIAMLLNVAIIYSCQVVTHEASHGNVFEENRFGRWPNQLAGYLFAIPLLWDFKTFQVIHLAHHVHTNDRMQDPQFRGNTVESWRNLSRFLRGLPGRLVGSRPEVHTGIDAQASKFHFAQPRSWYLFHSSLVLFFVLAPKVLLLVWVLPAFVATLLVVLMHNSLHTDAHGKASSLAKSKLIVSRGLLGRVLNVCFLYQNYHLIHHLMPRLPLHKTATVARMVLSDLPLRGIIEVDYSKDRSQRSEQNEAHVRPLR